MKLPGIFHIKHDKGINENKSPQNDKKIGNFPDNFENVDHSGYIPKNIYQGDGYLYSAWVNIAVNILIRNIARSAFVIHRGGEEVTRGPLRELFRRPNEELSGYDLWKETAAWWFIEGEAFWWYGPDYAGGIPKEIYILDPRRMRCEETGLGDVRAVRRWFYETGGGTIRILSDELVHFRDWNP
jgi:hypothetical protein